MITMKFTLARKLGEPKIDNKGDENVKEINDKPNEPNLFNMPLPPEEKVVDVNEDILNQDTDNNENVQNERNDENMGEVQKLNANRENERLDDEALKERLRNMNKGMNNTNSSDDDNKENSDDTNKEDINVNMDGEGKKGEENSELNEILTKNWEIENVQPVMIYKKIGKYSTQMSAGLLATMANENVIIYNPNNQRKLIKKRDKLVPYLMTSKIKQIYSKLISEELHGMLITLNSRIIRDENGNILNHINFDNENDVLKGVGVLDAVDGWHRISACRYWLRKWNKNQSLPNPWEYNFITAIERLDEQKAGLLFSEYGATQLKISSSKVKFLDINDYANIIVRHLMNNSLRNKVEIDKTSTKGTNHIVTFATLNDAIKKNYKITTEEDVEKINNFLNKFFIKLIIIFPEYFGNISKEERDLMRQKDLTLELQMFHGYIAISSRLYGKDNWEASLLKLKDKIKIGEWEGDILQTDCPLWDRIFRGGDNRKIVSSSVTRSFVSKTLGDYIEFGIDYVINSLKENE